MDDTQDISKLALALSDLELALLLCLAAQEHCLIETTENSVDDVAAELALICSHTYGLTYAIVDFSTLVTFDDLCDQICLRNTRRTVDALIAKNLDHASENMQLHALKLMHSKSLVAESTVIEAPAQFLFMPLVLRDSGQVQPKLNSHLNDQLIISYFHDSDDGYVYLEDDDWHSEGQASLSSVVHKPDIQKQNGHPSIDRDLLNKVYQASKTVNASAELGGFQHDQTSTSQN
ncbi:hypothetical protein AOCH_004700 [Aspergillus ochraceoroseus]|uniref:Uncharacterized protein n=1 Tax=Aspergillus ochraceoroseus TaxID=138278 RepID=A0A0F8UR98_9EURO|nr:hypothetical protein AOCH_004700 [Aspergillus ochraceoroseus]